MCTVDLLVWYSEHYISAFRVSVCVCVCVLALSSCSSREQNSAADSDDKTTPASQPALTQYHNTSSYGLYARTVHTHMVAVAALISGTAACNVGELLLVEVM